MSNSMNLSYMNLVNYTHTYTSGTKTLVIHKPRNSAPWNEQSESFKDTKCGNRYKDSAKAILWRDFFLVGPTSTQKFYGNLFDPTPPHSHPTPKKYGLIKGLASNNHDPLITYWGLFSWLVAWGWTGVSLGKAQNKIISWPRRDDLQWDLGKTMVIYRDHSPLGCYPATAKLKESGNGVDWSYGSYTISSTQQKRRCLNQWNVVPKLYKIPRPNIAPEKWPNPKRN